MASRSIPPEQMRLHFGETAPSFEEAEDAAPCKQCGKKVQTPEWFRTEGLQLNFCSETCRKAWVEESLSFEVELNRKAGHRGANWSLQARKARERDSYACQSCGVTEEELGRQLDVHHKIPYRSFKSNVEANKLEHLVSVCPKCHAHLEAELRQFLPLFRKS